MSNGPILAVIQVPLDYITSASQCATGHLNEVVYACQTGNNVYGVCLDSVKSCDPNNWAIHVAEKSCGSFPNQYPQLYCSRAYNPGQASTEASPYNYLTGQVPNSAPSTRLPTVNGNLPAASGGSPVLGGNFAVFTDNTANTANLGNGNSPGPAYMIVSYARAWFRNSQDISNFLSYNWANKSASTFTYQGKTIPSLLTQFNMSTTQNYAESPVTGTQVPAPIAPSFDWWWIILILIIIILIFLFASHRSAV